MQGRVQLFQEHPFECQSNYGALGALRCNLDVQDLRRVLPETEWLDRELPHLGDRPEYGYMNSYEWDGENWTERRPDKEPLGEEPLQWAGLSTAEEWRREVLQSLQADLDTSSQGSGSEEFHASSRLQGEVVEGFRDGLNTGFYINAYTTKLCPTMDGVLEEMRKGLERLRQTREAAVEAASARTTTKEVQIMFLTLRL